MIVYELAKLLKLLTISACWLVCIACVVCLGAVTSSVTDRRVLVLKRQATTSDPEETIKSQKGIAITALTPFFVHIKTLQNLHFIFLNFFINYFKYSYF